MFKKCKYTHPRKAQQNLNNKYRKKCILSDDTYPLSVSVAWNKMVTYSLSQILTENCTNIRFIVKTPHLTVDWLVNLRNKQTNEGYDKRQWLSS